MKQITHHTTAEILLKTSSLHFISELLFIGNVGFKSPYTAQPKRLILPTYRVGRMVDLG